MSQHYLILHDGTPSRLQLTHAVDLTLCSPSAELDYRISPIFPATPSAVLPDLETECFIGLFNYDRPFESIGQLLQGSDDFSKRIWFTLGLYSVIVHGDATELQELSQKQAPSLRAYELWHVKASAVVVVDHFLGAPAPYDIERYVLNLAPVSGEADIIHLGVLNSQPHRGVELIFAKATAGVPMV
ncbi:MAG TPA: hypothetical protein VM165_07205, partial [Planctomycetaceae bacterium]|nr:hypothetical protein [Planctomycetaceae bacterium]